MTRLDGRAVASALFLPLLLWTGSVIAVALLGYPGVIYMTPAAWLLALPVGLRVRRESESPGRQPVLEAALAGAVLGTWQGLLLIGMQALPGLLAVEPLEPQPLVLLSLGLGVPLTAGLAALVVVFMREK